VRKAACAGPRSRSEKRGDVVVGRAGRRQAPRKTTTTMMMIMMMTTTKTRMMRKTKKATRTKAVMAAARPLPLGSLQPL
jgi:hypothetical protein